MIVNEKDAHKHDCPMKLSSGAGTLNSMCSGKRCMAWRWRLIPNPDHKINHPLDYIHKNPAEMDSPWMNSDTHGYCGMAGNP